MGLASSLRCRRVRRRAQPGLAIGPSLTALALGSLLLGAGWWSLQWLTAGGPVADMITRRATVGPFEHDVSERGELESSNNTPVRCEVQSRSAAPTA